MVASAEVLDYFPEEPGGGKFSRIFIGQEIDFSSSFSWSIRRRAVKVVGLPWRFVRLGIENCEVFCCNSGLFGTISGRAFVDLRFLLIKF